MATEILLQHFLMYVVVPAWLAAGFAVWYCHLATCIERTSGVLESALHLLQFALVGVPLLAILFLQVNAGVLLVMMGGLVLHQAAATWDVRYANEARRVSPAEQHIHGVLEMVPVMASAIVIILNWPQFMALLGEGDTRFAVALKRPPLPAWYLWTVMLSIAGCGVLPYGEEFLRCARSSRFRKERPVGAGRVSVNRSR